MSVFGVTLDDGETIRIERRADPGAFLGLSLKNGLLNLVTLTLYRFWRLGLEPRLARRAARG